MTKSDDFDGDRLKSLAQSSSRLAENSTHLYKGLIELFVPRVYNLR